MHSVSDKSFQSVWRENIRGKNVIENKSLSNF